MDEQLKKLAAKAAGFWKGLSRPKRFGLLAGLAVLVAAVAVIVSLSTAVQYEPLYSGGLDSTQAAQVYKAVQAKGIAVKVSGDTVYVKKGTADEVRMQLAESGLPQGNLPYDVYSSGGNTWAETDQDREVKSLQQTQNRLQDAIDTITGVTQSIVTVAQGNNDTYVLETDKQPTTASVVITMQQGYQLTQSQVNAIVQMVAHSVSGLTADNVSVTDENGTLLSGSGDGYSSASSQLELQSRYENTMRAKALTLLEQVYGKGNVDVAVNANFDFSKRSTVTQSYTSGVPSSVSQSSSVTTSNAAGASGLTGNNGGQVTYPGTAASSGGTVTSAASNSQTNYAVGSVQQQIEDQGGRLQKLTVAVVLNSGSPSTAAANTGNLRQMLANALGTAVNNVSVSQLSFSSASSALPSAASGGGFRLGGGNGVFVLAAAGGLVALGLLLMLVLLLLRRRRKKREAKKQAELLALAQAEAEKQAAAGKTPGEPKRPPVKSIEETIADSQKDSVKSQIEDFADKKPELVAQLLKNWLKD